LVCRPVRERTSATATMESFVPQDRARIGACLRRDLLVASCGDRGPAPLETCLGVAGDTVPQGAENQLSGNSAEPAMRRDDRGGRGGRARLRFELFRWSEVGKELRVGGLLPHRFRGLHRAD
jgi:hypothetical protein